MFHTKSLCVFDLWNIEHAHPRYRVGMSGFGFTVPIQQLEQRHNGSQNITCTWENGDFEIFPDLEESLIFISSLPVFDEQ